MLFQKYIQKICVKDYGILKNIDRKTYLLSDNLCTKKHFTNASKQGGT